MVLPRKMPGGRLGGLFAGGHVDVAVGQIDRRALERAIRLQLVILILRQDLVGEEVGHSSVRSGSASGLASGLTSRPAGVLTSVSSSLSSIFAALTTCSSSDTLNRRKIGRAHV